MPVIQRQNPMPQATESEDDQKLLVRFFMDAVQDHAASAEEGRPIFHDRAMVSIIVPGSRDEYIGPATVQYQNRFPRHWAMFQQQLEQTVDGTPLEEVPFLTVAQVRELKAINCITLEQLAGLSDTALGRGMGLRVLRDKAVALVEAAKDAAPITKLQSQLEERDNRIESLEQMVAKLEEKLSLVLETEE